MHKDFLNSDLQKQPDPKKTRKQRSETPQENRSNETPWRNAQKSDVPDYDDEPGRMQQIEDSVKNGEYLPHTKVKHTTAGE
jgi:hypothetical protein